MKAFLLGVAVATSACGAVWALNAYKERKRRANHERKKRSSGFNPLSHGLAVIHPLSNGSLQSESAMVALAYGENLIFKDIESRLLLFLGYRDSNNFPRSVYDLLPNALAARHQQWVSAAIQQGILPERLNHPLRSVEVMHHSGIYIKMDLNIKWLTEKPDPFFELIFTPSPTTAPEAPLRVGEQIEHQDAYVMLLDIVEFTKACGQLTALEVLEWMKKVRHAIEDMLAVHKLQLIETRGDNYLAITTEADGPLPATRAVAFAVGAAAAAAALHDTRVRIGLARGSVTVAQLQCMGSREVLCLFGDVVNVTGRLEQSADPAHLLLSESVAAQYARDNGLPPPPIRVIPAKGKPEGIRCARLDWQAGVFVDADPPPPPGARPAGPPRALSEPRLVPPAAGEAGRAGAGGLVRCPSAP